jgi:hypothetical protein
MAKCFWHYYGETCDAVATTVLKANDGRISQVCEKHYTILVKQFGKIAHGEERWHGKRGETAANHWFVNNKIPI